jgi:anti-sigma factor RsiW
MTMATGDLTCRELVELVTAYLEGALPLPERRRFEAHLRGCESCWAYLEQIRLTIRSVGGLAEDDVPAPALDSLLGAFRRWKAS